VRPSSSNQSTPDRRLNSAFFGQRTPLWGPSGPHIGDYPPKTLPIAVCALRSPVGTVAVMSTPNSNPPSFRPGVLLYPLTGEFAGIWVVDRRGRSRDELVAALKAVVTHALATSDTFDDQAGAVAEWRRLGLDSYLGHAAIAHDIYLCVAQPVVSLPTPTVTAPS
jgi:hypothetical protein